MKLQEIDGATLKSWAEWLLDKDCGCCHMPIGRTRLHEVDICLGWHDFDGNWGMAWKIGWQTFNNAMQCDFDIDFEMPCPCNRYGDVYDTLSLISPANTNWDRLADDINAVAKAAFKCARKIDRAKDE